MKKIAIYNIEKDKLNKIQSEKLFKDIAIITFYDENLVLTVKELFENTIEGVRSDKYHKTYVIMNEITPDDFKIINSFLKTLDLNFIAVTRNNHNESWELDKLFNEVTQEDKQFVAKDELKRLLVSLNDIDLSKYSNSDTFALKKALMDGFLILNSDDISLNIIENSINNIKYLLNKLN